MKKLTKLDLASVLVLINRGRAAMEMPPLKELPSGVLGDPYQSVLGRAFGASVTSNEDLAERCCYCGCSELSVTIADRKTALALARLFESNRVQRVGDGWSVRAPQILAAFDQEFHDGRLPDLIDRDCIGIEEAAKYLGRSEEIVKAWIASGLISAVRTPLDDTYVRRSGLPTAQHKGKSASRAAA